MSKRDYDPIVCVDCGYQSDDEDDFEWAHAERLVNYPGEPYCTSCAGERGLFAFSREDDGE